MGELFRALQVLLPAALESELGAPDAAASHRDAFRTLQEGGRVLASHGSPLPRGSRLLASDLAQDVNRAEAFFSRGSFDNAGFLVTQIVDGCVACHARTGSEDSALTAGFADGAAVRDADPLERAAIAAATRRFDEALTLYERAFQEPNASAAILLGPITRYLTVALRVSKDPERAAATIDRLRDQAATPPNVKADLDHWARALRSVTRTELSTASSEVASASLERAIERSRYPNDRRPLVEFLVASAQLHELASKPHESPARAAETYERLGRAELGIAQNSWLTRADRYWETAIRLAPKSPAARRSLELLEKEVALGFTGSSGVRIPADEARRLAELRDLVDGDPLSAREGRALFAQHCALCHGADGTGNGPYATELLWSPADLTRIAERRGGHFPRDEVFELIARRDPLGSHRSPEMPRWGEFWTGDEKIEALVSHLESLQVE